MSVHWVYYMRRKATRCTSEMPTYSQCIDTARRSALGKKPLGAAETPQLKSEKQHSSEALHMVCTLYSRTTSLSIAHGIDSKGRGGTCWLKTTNTLEAYRLHNSPVSSAALPRTMANAYQNLASV